MTKYKNLIGIHPMPGIYKITSPAGKIYIGRSINIKKRFREHLNASSSTHIGRSIRKYGYSAHKFEVLCYTINENDLLNRLEVFFIDYHNSTNPEIGLNLSAGGGRLNFNHRPETIEKMKKNRAGWQNSLGRKLSDETKEKIRNSLNGRKASADAVQNVKLGWVRNGRTKIYFDTFTGVFYYSERDMCSHSDYTSRTTLRAHINKDLRYKLC